MGNSIVSISLNGKFHLREKKKSLTFLISICCQVQLNGNGWHIPPCHPISTIRMVGEYLMLVQNTSVEERSLFYFKEKWGFDPEFDHVEIKISHLILSRQIFLLDILGKCQGWGGERGQDWDMGQDGRGSKERLHITLIMHFLTWRLSPCRKKKWSDSDIAWNPNKLMIWFMADGETVCEAWICPEQKRISMEFAQFICWIP